MGPENGRGAEGVKAIPNRIAPLRLPERLAWPAAALLILGISLLLWTLLGFLLVALIG
ncbi:hypothetical protein [Crenalkalicoccus roseus]|uniref:hypothetical protein n=1 Tax=Crenalkalicoccus roseus TaxID=1485588 RepID=UPI001305384A|nr:hypothetical protein [Crenalkalicoccus roseus]